MTLPLDPKAALTVELDRLAARQLASRGALMRGVEAVGRLTEGAATTLLGMSPIQLEKVLESAFRQLYDLSGRSDGIGIVRQAPLIANRAAAVASGAAGGWFGLAGIVPDLVASTTVIFNSIQKVARQHGFDTTDPMVRLECLAVFQFGEPGEAGNAAAKSFLANRLLTNGQTVSALISRFATQFATRLTTKLGAQAVPVIGAVTGAAINYAFVDYYEGVAQIHFRLLRLAQDHPDLDIDAEYAAALTRARSAPRGLGARMRRVAQKGTSSPPPAG
ncbi:protein EcsC [Paracoccus liaowanqingii]|uniref:Protein EcsC n=1 Tax=Paracoccus liaowanqingii TaxID=2560053 RepID=A0A4P7HKM5_9RHOB|nr:EcsC family protein [Paracoccus liaowanqingii]QBX33797.1 protein EcsC [Paracoccus liaowanqingii]